MQGEAVVWGDGCIVSIDRVFFDPLDLGDSQWPKGVAT